nr:hypothetical protein [Tanacetum cinerariifolium]
MESIHVQFDELTEHMAPVRPSPGPTPSLLTPGPISSGLVLNPAPAVPYVPPTNKELELLFQPMFDEYFNPPALGLADGTYSTINGRDPRIKEAIKIEGHDESKRSVYRSLESSSSSYK